MTMNTFRVKNFETFQHYLLVKHGIIEADDCSIVRSVHASWSEAVQGVRITVEQVA